MDMEAFAKQMLGIRDEAVATGCCAICGAEVNEDNFRDEVSRREFGLSGMCQSCQDAFFE